MTNEPEWMKRFNKKIKENYFVTPSSHLNVYGLKAFIKEEKEKTKSELLSKIEEEMEEFFGKEERELLLEFLSKYKEL